jgi:hypothetical protein
LIEEQVLASILEIQINGLVENRTNFGDNEIVPSQVEYEPHTL